MMRRTSSWLVGAWVHVSDGKPEARYSLIGMTLKHFAPWASDGFYQPGYCIILLHDLDERWFHRVASGLTLTYRFEQPGLVLEWSAFAENHSAGIGEGNQVRVEFIGRPRIITTDERWDALRQYYGVEAESAVLNGG